ncbi:hypothetical protein C8J56DRAFT_882148 [Mycena floridula]|nr:hypothetical protein C8J56DRAFT_882148 [Mycena floridula]
MTIISDLPDGFKDDHRPECQQTAKSDVCARPKQSFIAGHVRKLAKKPSQYSTILVFLPMVNLCYNCTVFIKAMSQQKHSREAAAFKASSHLRSCKTPKSCKCCSFNRSQIHRFEKFHALVDHVMKVCQIVYDGQVAVEWVNMSGQGEAAHRVSLFQRGSDNVVYGITVEVFSIDMEECGVHRVDEKPFDDAHKAHFIESGHLV